MQNRNSTPPRSGKMWSTHILTPQSGLTSHQHPTEPRSLSKNTPCHSILGGSRHEKPRSPCPNGVRSPPKTRAGVFIGPASDRKSCSSECSHEAKRQLVPYNTHLLVSYYLPRQLLRVQDDAEGKNWRQESSVWWGRSPRSQKFHLGFLSYYDTVIFWRKQKIYAAACSSDP